MYAFEILKKIQIVNNNAVRQQQVNAIMKTYPQLIDSIEDGEIHFSFALQGELVPVTMRITEHEIMVVYDNDDKGFVKA